MDDTQSTIPSKCGFEEALDVIGFGRYNILALISCCLVILAMVLDIFGPSVVLPAIACDMGLNTQQQGLISAVPLIGVMVSSYAWGLFVDMYGRRKTLLLAMPIGFVLNLATSFAPTFPALVAFKFFCACFTSAGNSAGFVLMAESVSREQRGRCMFFLAAITLSSQLVASLFALPVLGLGFKQHIPVLNIDYVPWRFVVLLKAIPGIFGIIGTALLCESPKFLLSKGRGYEAMEALKYMYSWNTALSRDDFPVKNVYLDDVDTNENEEDDNKTSLIRKMWNQTVPLLKPPLLRNSAIVYYLLLCAYMTSTGFTIWVPTVTNAYFSDHDVTGQTFCEVASSVARHKTNSTTIDCDNVMPALTLYAVMIYSGSAVLLSMLTVFIIKPLGKKKSTLLIFLFCGMCGILLLFVRIPMLSIGLFYLFLYVAFILGNANTYLVELNPTYLRGMATCLSVIVARGFGFFSVQLIATLIKEHCVPMISGYIALVFSGFLVALLLPTDNKKSVLRKET